MGTFRIFEELSQVMDPGPARKLTEILDAMYTDLQQTVTRADLKGLENALTGLARAQTETENRLGRLETVLFQLAEAQKQTEQRIAELADKQARTEQRVAELAEKQAQTEQRIAELAEKQAQTEQRLAELAEKQAQTEQRLAELAQKQAQTEQRIAELAEKQARTEERVAELAQAQQSFEQRLARLENIVADLVQAQAQLTLAQKETEKALKQLIQRVDIHEQRLAKLDGRTLEMQFRDKAPAYLGRVLRRTRVVSVGDIGEDLEGVLTPGEWDDLRMADIILTGRADMGGRKTDVFVVVEVSVTVDAADVERAARRAALLRKKGWKAIAVAAGDSASDELVSLAAHRGVAVLRDGQEFNWPQALAAA